MSCNFLDISSVFFWGGVLCDLYDFLRQIALALQVSFQPHNDLNLRIVLIIDERF
jgi:hypothetical protein